jgi:hypothetical protein
MNRRTFLSTLIGVVTFATVTKSLPVQALPIAEVEPITPDAVPDESANGNAPDGTPVELAQRRSSSRRYSNSRHRQNRRHHRRTRRRRVCRTYRDVWGRRRRRCRWVYSRR